MVNVEEKSDSSAKRSKKNGSGFDIGKAMATGNFVGMTTSDLNRFMTTKIQAVQQKVREKLPPEKHEAYTAKGAGKGGKGKGGKGSTNRDWSKTQCYNCQQMGHMASTCTNPKAPRQKEAHSANGQTKSKKGQKRYENPAVKSAPY